MSYLKVPKFRQREKEKQVKVFKRTITRLINTPHLFQLHLFVLLDWKSHVVLGQTCARLRQLMLNKEVLTKVVPSLSSLQSKYTDNNNPPIKETKRIICPYHMINPHCLVYRATCYCQGRPSPRGYVMNCGVHALAPGRALQHSHPHQRALEHSSTRALFSL